MDLVYLGPSHFRELNTEDYEKLGLEVEFEEGQDKEIFVKGEPFEANKEVAKVFLTSPLLAGEFAEYDPETMEPPKAPLTDGSTLGGADDASGGSPAGSTPGVTSGSAP